MMILKLLQFKRSRVKLIVRSLFRDKFFVIAALDYSAVIENHNHIGIHNRGKPVSDNEYRSALHKPIHSALNYRFRSRID